MTRQKFYLLIDSVYELGSGTIKGHEPLSDTDVFDSLAMLSLLSMLDKNFDIQMRLGELRRCETVEGLFHKVTSTD